MNLRKKLLTVFSGLALLGLTHTGVTVWATFKWQETNQQLENHYQRSLLLQRVKTATFRAFQEVPAVVNGNDKNARQEFEKYLKPADNDFQRWVELADTPGEKQQVKQVRAAYQELVKDARTIFNLVTAGRENEAVKLMQGELENKHLVNFERLTQEAVISDQNYRLVVQAQTQQTRQTAQLILAIAAFGIICLILLLMAYLAADLFAPLQEIELALNDVGKGDLERRLDEERKDELGAINRAFNRMTEAIAHREALASIAIVPVSEENDGTSWQNTPSRLTLHRMVSQLRSRVLQLGENTNNDGKVATAQEKEDVVQEVDRLLQAVARVTEFGFPLDLNLARTDIRGLLYEVLLRFYDEFAQRGISFDLNIAPEVNYAMLDRLKMREALGELVRNAIAALPERGGQLGIRARIAEDKTTLLLEVADNGIGAEPILINRAFTSLESEEHQRPNIGLKLTKAIVEQHGGQLAIDSQPAQGTYVQISLPWRE